MSKISAQNFFLSISLCFIYTVLSQFLFHFVVYDCVIHQQQWQRICNWTIDITRSFLLQEYSCPEKQKLQMLFFISETFQRAIQWHEIDQYEGWEYQENVSSLEF